MRFGVSTQLYHGQRLRREHLDEIAAHGFDTIEIIATRSHFDYHDPAVLDETARWLTETGLRVSSMHAPIAEAMSGGRWIAPLSNASPEEAVRARAVAEARAALDLARRVPVGVLVVHLGLPASLAPAPGENDAGAARRSVDEIVAAAGPLGVKVALENIPNALATPEAVVAAIEHAPAWPGLGACLDFGHANLMGGVVDAIETLSGHLLTTHVHDNGGRRDDHLPPGEGSIDWPGALAALKKVGYEGILMLEVAAVGPTTAAVLGRMRGACERLNDEARSWS